MTEYNDIQQVNALLSEQRATQSAIDILDNSGTVTAVTVAPRSDPENPAANMMPTQVAIRNAPETLVTDVRSGLAQRYNEINQELVALGVTGVPADAV